MVAIDNLDLAILHAGGSGASVCQCKTAVITTTKDVPMQVDGEPVMMKPCRIEISLGNQSSAPSAKMLVRNKTATCKNNPDALNIFQEGDSLKKSWEQFSLGVLKSQMAMSFLQRSILYPLIINMNIHLVILIKNFC